MSPAPTPRIARGTDPVLYRIAPSDPHAHLFTVAMTIATPALEGQRLALPAWIPGSYMIREFARHVVALAARDVRGPLRVDKLDKHTWRVAPANGPIVVEYTVYAWDLSVRAAHLDATHGFLNATSVCLRVVGQESRPCTVELEPPPASVARGWKVATTLPEAGAKRGGFGRYRAADYDALADHPVEMGTFELARFEAGGAEHEIAVTGRTDVDLERLVRDLAPVCAAQSALFEPRTKRAPFERYLFLTTAVGDGYGGLEHRDSTALLCGRNDLPWRGMAAAGDGYRTFLGLASHEYFHAWHVKRIKPAAFVPHDFDREAYTRLLWIFEGFTSYYDDLMLVRAGTIPRADYLKALARTISLVQRAPGRTVQSVADSSFDAWIKYYRQDENSPNAIVSYYAKGSLVALAIDLAVRARTQGRASLDDAMRLMWRRYGRDFYAPGGGPGAAQSGLREDGFPVLLREATGVSLGAQLARWVDGTDELPLARLLAPLGIALTFAPADAAPSLGVRTTTKGGELAIATAYTGGAAQRAGLSAGDVLVAVDGLRVDEKSLKALLSRRRAGDAVEVHAFRRDELLRVAATLDAPPRSEATLRAGTAENALRRGWLGERRATRH
ncbi:MAG: PDZ domain-containing protein [Burkholderiaceae bacterium]|nr:M61 family metallopeptidase [Burkholderiales bacterium]MCZ8108692.1 PDZ domain-containing protein [Burkholderiales bacterium]MCZ8338707.1 PDZ domain-containing protein [Burkholderiaceae bacterium]